MVVAQLRLMAASVREREQGRKGERERKSDAAHTSRHRGSAVRFKKRLP
jgi:hypothetical protein